MIVRGSSARRPTPTAMRTCTHKQTYMLSMLLTHNLVFEFILHGRHLGVHCSNLMMHTASPTAGKGRSNHHTLLPLDKAPPIPALASLVRALGTSWIMRVRRPSSVRLSLWPPAVGVTRVSCVWPAGGGCAPPWYHQTKYQPSTHSLCDHHSLGRSSQGTPPWLRHCWPTAQPACGPTSTPPPFCSQGAAEARP
jgi:hypothetical protein